MRAYLKGLVILVFLTIPLSSWGCEPVVPLVQLLSGSSLAGPLYLTQSLFWLVVAVAIKSAAFVFFERRLPWRKAVGYMLLANILSTIPGVLIAAFTASIGGVILAIPIVYLLAKVVERRISLIDGPDKKRWWVFGGSTVLMFIGFFFISMVMYGLAESAIYNNGYAGYWIFKFIFVTLVATTGIVMSAVLEECAIFRLSRKKYGNLSFYTSVIRANYVTLGLILSVAAVEILPRRLRAPHFIVSWLHSLMLMLGLSC